MYISIRHKIAAALFISVFVLTLMINLFNQFLTYKEFKEHIQGDAEASVKLAISQANRWFQDYMTAANLLGLQAEKFAETILPRTGNLGNHRWARCELFSPPNAADA